MPHPSLLHWSRPSYPPSLCHEISDFTPSGLCLIGTICLKLSLSPFSLCATISWNLLSSSLMFRCSPRGHISRCQACLPGLSLSSEQIETLKTGCKVREVAAVARGCDQLMFAVWRHCDPTAAQDHVEKTMKILLDRSCVSRWSRRRWGWDRRITSAPLISCRSSRGFNGPWWFLWKETGDTESQNKVYIMIDMETCIMPNIWLEGKRSLLKETPTNKKGRHYPLTPMSKEGWVRFYGPPNISGASQQKSSEALKSSNDFEKASCTALNAWSNSCSHFLHSLLRSYSEDCTPLFTDIQMSRLRLIFHFQVECSFR